MKPKYVILYRSQRVLFHKVCPRQERKLNCGGWLVPKSLARLDLSGNGIEAVYVLVAVISKLHVVRMYMFSNEGVFVDNTQLSFTFQNSKRLCHQSNLPSCRGGQRRTGWQTGLLWVEGKNGMVCCSWIDDYGGRDRSTHIERTSCVAKIDDVSGRKEEARCWTVQSNGQKMDVEMGGFIWVQYSKAKKNHLFNIMSLLVANSPTRKQKLKLQKSAQYKLIWW